MPGLGVSGLRAGGVVHGGPRVISTCDGRNWCFVSRRLHAGLGACNSGGCNRQYLSRARGSWCPLLARRSARVQAAQLWPVSERVRQFINTRGISGKDIAFVSHHVDQCEFELSPGSSPLGRPLTEHSHSLPRTHHATQARCHCPSSRNSTLPAAPLGPPRIRSLHRQGEMK